MRGSNRARSWWHRSALGVLSWVVITYVALIVVSTIVYWATGSISRLDDALFESVAGFTTTSMTVVDPEALPTWVLFWRAFTQWLGGAAALGFALVVVPAFGGQRRLSETGEHRGRRTILSISWASLIGRIAMVYAGLTVAMMVAYFSAGMGGFDAVTFGLTTASTGGFANYQDSFAHFDSAAIEWVGAVGMGLAGTSIAALVWLLRGRIDALWRSTELRLYLGLMLASGLLMTMWNWQKADGGLEAVRHSLFTVTSAMSTTGFRATDWSEWIPASQTLLLVLIGVGSMAGSAGGGFRTLRLLTVIGVVRRELILQLHPRAVVKVKVGGVAVSEESVTRAHNYQILSVITAALGVIGIAALGSDLTTAISGAVTAVATAGPGLGELAGFADATVLAGPARAVVMALMLLGRLSIYPVVVVLGWAVGASTTGLRR